MVGPVVERRPVSPAQALGWGFLTAVATGLFAVVLLLVVTAVKDPTELGDPALRDGSFWFGYLMVAVLWGVPFALLLGWLPISVTGWATQRLAMRWPLLWTRWAHALIGAGGGALVCAIVELQSRPFDYWFTGFGATNGVFAALLFLRLTAPRSQRGG